MSRQEQIHQIFDVLTEAQAVVHCNRIAAFKELGLTRSHFWALRMIDKHPGPIAIKELAAKLNVTSGAVSQLSDYLFEKDLIIRREEATDRRVVKLELTAKAHETFKYLRQAHLEHIQALFVDFNEKDLQTLAELLTKLKLEKHDVCK